MQTDIIFYLSKPLEITGFVDFYHFSNLVTKNSIDFYCKSYILELKIIRSMVRTSGN